MDFSRIELYMLKVYISLKLLLINCIIKMTYINVKNKVIEFISAIANQQRRKYQGKISGNKCG